MRYLIRMQSLKFSQILGFCRVPGANFRKVVGAQSLLVQQCCYCSSYSGVNFHNRNYPAAARSGRHSEAASVTDSGESQQPAYDVVVVGGGHAGCEASHAAARMGARTLLITHKISTVGAMSCNPSFGGIGKGHLLREIDALDGLCPRICDKAGIHYKVLNRRKGPAVWGLRAQMDRRQYLKYLQEELLAMPGLTVREAAVEDLKLGEGEEEDVPAIEGVVLATGELVSCRCVVITAGTFLRGETHMGLEVRPAGRAGDGPAVGLAKTLEKLGFRVGRLKTGTPPRLLASSIDYSVCVEHKPDQPPLPFSFLHKTVNIKPEDQLSCYMTWTPTSIEKVVKDSIHLNHHVKEETCGPRYCPSIESKVLKFPGRQHQVWLEPEGMDCDEVYPAGLSCTMPPEQQEQLIRLIPGLGAAKLTKPGYGVAYDYLDPRDLQVTLESRLIGRLFLAGQVNGTTGYEEAAAQGLLAGVNAAARSNLSKEVQEQQRLVVDRTEGYMGVLVDDLTTQGTTEPYRMFTSRAEFRLSLRPDNADARLTSKGHAVGCVSDARYDQCAAELHALKCAIELMRADVRSQRRWAALLGLSHTSQGEKKDAFTILGFWNWNVTVARLAAADPTTAYAKLQDNSALCARLHVEAAYDRIVVLQQADIDEVRKEEDLCIPKNMDYYSTEMNLSNEMRSKLSAARPESIAAAGRVAGVTPAAVVTLLKHSRRRARNSATTTQPSS